MGGDGAHEGRLEVCFNGHWGTVCEDRWSNRDAEAVCGILGFQRTGVCVCLQAVVFTFLHVDYFTAVMVFILPNFELFIKQLQQLKVCT